MHFLFALSVAVFALAASTATAFETPNWSEVREMAAICQAMNGVGLGDPPEKLVDVGVWKLDPHGEGKSNDPSQFWGFARYGNRWAVYKKDGASNTYAIVVRGTVLNDNLKRPSQQRSVIQDALALTSRADKVWFPDKDGGWRAIQLAENDGSTVHIGFAYGLVDILFHENGQGLLGYLQQLPPNSEIYITGHSQGAAIATLLHAFLLRADRETNAQYKLAGKNFRLRSYVFAQPKPGNWQFAMDFSRGAYKAGSDGFAYVINNANDWVPQVPLSTQGPTGVIKSVLSSVSADQGPLYGSLIAMSKTGETVRQKINSLMMRSVFLRDTFKDVKGMAFDEKITDAFLLGSGAESVASLGTRKLGELNGVLEGGVLKLKDLGPQYFSEPAAKRPNVKDSAGDSTTYVPVGTLIALPLCRPRKESAGEPSEDFMLEHHMATYVDLMSEANLKEPDKMKTCKFTPLTEVAATVQAH